MPGRHVRFSNTDSFYSPPPGLSLSASSGTSSSGPSTPPHATHATLPGPTPFDFSLPKPKGKTTQPAQAQAHTLLQYSDSPLLNYDVSFPPSSISTHYHGISAARMAEAAVSPPQAALTLHTPHLPWQIPITASNGRFVTVSDVLNEIHRVLRTNITPAEFRALGSQELMDRAVAAYKTRYRRRKQPQDYADEKAQGVKRVDFLMGWHRFRGLSATATPDMWQLHIA